MGLKKHLPARCCCEPPPPSLGDFYIFRQQDGAFHKVDAGQIVGTVYLTLPGSRYAMEPHTTQSYGAFAHNLALGGGGVWEVDQNLSASFFDLGAWLQDNKLFPNVNLTDWTVSTDGLLVSWAEYNSSFLHYYYAKISGGGISGKTLVLQWTTPFNPTAITLPRIVSVQEDGGAVASVVTRYLAANFTESRFYRNGQLLAEVGGSAALMHIVGNSIIGPNHQSPGTSRYDNGVKSPSSGYNLNATPFDRISHGYWQLGTQSKTFFAVNARTIDDELVSPNNQATGEVYAQNRYPDIGSGPGRVIETYSITIGLYDNTGGDPSNQSIPVPLDDQAPLSNLTYYVAAIDSYPRLP